jgi:AhpC/TSA family
MGFGFYGTYALLWGIVLFQGLLILALLRYVMELRRSVETGGGLGLDPLPIGSEAPMLVGRERAGHRLLIEGLRGGAAVLLFVTPDCSMCKTVLDGLRRRDLGRRARVVVVCVAAEEACAAMANRTDPGLTVVADPGEDLLHTYRVTATPTAVILDEEGRVRGYTYPKDAGELEAKLASTLGPRRDVKVAAASL